MELEGEKIETRENQIVKLPDHRIDIFLSGSGFEAVLDGLKEEFITEIKKLIIPFYKGDVEGYYQVEKAKFTFKGYIKDFGFFETVKWPCLRPKMKELAEASFAKLVSSDASNTSIDSAYGSDDLHFDALHEMLGPANDSRYSSMDDLSSDVKEEVNSLQLIHFW